MKNPLKIFFLLSAAFLTLASVSIVGMQLLGASSNASYAVHLLLFSIVIFGLYCSASSMSKAAMIAVALLGGLFAAIIPIEVLIFTLQSSNSGVLPGDPFPDSQATASYWTAVGVLFLIHSTLLSIASILVRVVQLSRRTEPDFQALQEF